MDLLLYVSRGAPNLLLDEVTAHRASEGWNTLFAHSNRHPEDDGHLSKVMRAIAHGEIICRPFEAQARERGLAITGDMWLKVGNMGKLITLNASSQQGSVANISHSQGFNPETGQPLGAIHGI